MPSGDTSSDARRVQVQAWRNLGPEGRVAMAARMSEEARRITLQGIRARHPAYGDHEARLALFRLIHGDRLFREAWPGEPLLVP